MIFFQINPIKNKQANKQTPCPRNVIVLLSLAMDHTKQGDVIRSRRFFSILLPEPHKWYGFLSVVFPHICEPYFQSTN